MLRCPSIYLVIHDFRMPTPTFPETHEISEEESFYYVGVLGLFRANFRSHTFSGSNPAELSANQTVRLGAAPICLFRTTNGIFGPHFFLET